MRILRRKNKPAASPARGKHLHVVGQRSVTTSDSSVVGTLLSLESRLMFDGAAVATAGAVTSEQSAQNQAEASSSDSSATVDTISPAPTGEPQFTTDEQALFDALAAYDTSAARQEIVFVSSSVLEYQQLLDGISPNVEVIILDPARGGIEQIAEALAGRTGIDAIHLIGHGTEAEIELGSSSLTQASISTQYAEQFQQIGASLSADADILIYGCNFGRGEAGQAAIQTLAALTGADVAASTDATGHVELGGDWNLEVQTGSIETEIAIDQTAQDNWSDLLGVVDWDSQTWTAGSTPPVSQVLTLSDGSTATVSITQNGTGVLTSAATSNTYTGGLIPAQNALQLGMDINPATETITVRIDFSSQPGGSVNNVSLSLFDVDNNEFAVFNSNVGNPTSATTSTTNTFNGTNRVSGNGAGANQTTGDGNTTVTFAGTGITWVEFTYGSTTAATPIVILHDILFNSTTAGGPTLDLNDNDASQSASDNFDDTAPFNAAYNNASGGTVPWATNWIEVDGVGAAQSATAGEVQIVDVDPTAGVDGEIRIGRDTGAASSIQRAVDLTNYINPTLSFDYRTSNTLENTDTLVVEVSKDAGVTFTTLQTFTNDSTGTASLSLAGYESANTIIRFRVTGGYTAADEFFFVDNVTISAEPTGHTAAYTEGGSAVGISDTDVVITDASSANMNGGTVTIARNFTAGDTLTFTNVGSVTGSYNALTGVLTISGVDTKANYQTFLASVRYSSTSDNPTAGGTATTRTISTVVRDQTTQLPSNTALTTVTITAVNDAPVVDLNAGGAGQDVTTAFTEQTPVLIAPVGTLTDVDSANLSALTVTLTARPDGNAVEGLSLNAAATTAATGAGLTVSYTPATGVLSITGSATTAVYQMILQGIQYTNTSDAPTTSNRSITVVANDGALPSASQTVTLTVTSVNDAPGLNAAQSPALTAMNEDAGAPVGAVGTLITSLVDFAVPAGQVDNITDVDSGALLGIAVTAADTTNGTWFYSTNNGASWNALGAVAGNSARLLAADANTRLYFQPNADYNGTLPTAITFRAWDQTSGANGGTADTTTNGGTTAFSTATDTAALTVNAVNDAPTAMITPLTYSATEQTSLTLHGTGLSIADIDAGAASVTATVSVTSGTVSAAAGTTGVTIGGSGTATVTLTGTLVQVNNLLAGNLSGTLTYINASDTPPPSATLTLSVNDGGNTGSGGALVGSDTATINLTAVDDAPVNTVPGAQTVNEDTALVFSVGNGNLISIGDVDAGGSAVQVTLTGANGTITLSGLTGLAFTVGDGTADATMTFIGTVANINTALAGLSFTPTANFNGTASLQIVTNDLGNTGTGGPLSDTDTVAITVTAVNDGAATFGGATSGSGAEDGGAITGTLTAVDPDGAGATPFAVTVGATNGTASIDAATGAWSYTPNANFAGADSFTVTYTDAQGFTSTQVISLTVTAVNDGAVNVVPGAQTVAEDTALAIAGVSVTDVDGDLATTQLAVGNGIVTVSLAGGATISAGANGTGTLTLTGTQAQINAALVTISYQGNLNFTGADLLTVTSTDSNAVVDTDTVAITVTPVANSAPSLTTNAGSVVVQGLTDIITSAKLRVTDSDNTPDQLVYTVTSLPRNGHLELTTAPGVAITTFTQADINAGRLMFVHNGAVSASESFTFTVSDGAGGLIGASTFTIAVSPFAPPPPPLPIDPGPGPGPGPSPISGTGPTPGSMGTRPPVLQPPPVDIQTVGVPDELVKRVALASKNNVRAENPDIVIQEPMPLWVEPLSIPVKKMLAVGHRLAERLTKMADDLDREIEERERQTHLIGRLTLLTGMVLSAGFLAWIIRGGALVTSFLVSMPAWRRFDPLPILKANNRDRRKRDREVQAEHEREDRQFRGIDRILKPFVKPTKPQEKGRGEKPNSPND